MSVQVISDELAARLDNMTPETRAMRFGKVLQNLQTALNDEIAEGPMIYIGAWNALTNTPTLADGTGSNGNTYRVSVGGTQDLGSGNLTFAADDRVIYNGTTWEKWDANDAVQSVFSRTGAVVAQAGDYAAHYAPIKPQCEWRADTHAGYGSTDTKIPYFTNVRVNVDTASAITVTNNSTNGCMVLINTADYYTFSYNASPASASYIGFSLNSAQLTTGVDGINVQNRLALAYIVGTETARVSVRLWCAVNDVVRPHTNAVAADTAAFSNFSVTRG